MKKFFIFSSIALSSFLISGCSHVRTETPKKSLAHQTAPLMETVELDEQDVFVKNPKTGEYTHEMAEADADDKVIQKEVGAAEIDEELPSSETERVPYARNFLAPKKTKRMQFWVDYFTKKERERFQRFINNGEEYRKIIEDVFEDHGLPKELYFVGLIESGYYLGARSHASAVGPWQFIKGTGQRYGLKITREYDERQDLFKASKAAAMYFRDLHNVFSSWELALSAYNAGEYGIIRRIMKHGTRDFYELSRNKQLPSETINYVPKVLAAMHVVKNAEKYGFVIPKKKHRLFDLTELKATKKNVPLSTIASRLNVSVALLRKLNPELKKNSTPRYVSGDYYLRIPKTKYSYRLEEVTATEVAKASYPSEKKKLTNRRTAEATPKFHRVKRGETLVSIARKYDVSPREIAKFNDFRTWRTRLQAGQKIAITENEEQVVTTQQASTPRVKVTKRPIVYKVAEGDNLTYIAKIFNLKVSKIKKANRLKRGSIMVGQKIVLPDTKKAIYTVRQGDHLTKVAREFNQPIEALVKLNALKKYKIYPGQKLIVNMD